MVYKTPKKENSPITSSVQPSFSEAATRVPIVDSFHARHRPRKLGLAIAELGSNKIFSLCLCWEARPTILT
jgi:hypothetical protein